MRNERAYKHHIAYPPPRAFEGRLFSPQLPRYHHQSALVTSLGLGLKRVPTPDAPSLWLVKNSCEAIQPSCTTLILFDLCFYQGSLKITEESSGYSGTGDLERFVTHNYQMREKENYYLPRNSKQVHFFPRHTSPPHPLLLRKKSAITVFDDKEENGETIINVCSIARTGSTSCTSKFHAREPRAKNVHNHTTSTMVGT